jgi:PAS domain-containing protein
VKEVLDNALQGREAANFEFPLYTKDQRRVDVLLNATTRRDVSGNLVGVLGVGQDITERKQVEMEKTRVAKELQTFIDTANAPIFGIDANGLVNEWNNKSAAITGFSREEVLGKNLVQVTNAPVTLPLSISYVYTLFLPCSPLSNSFDFVISDLQLLSNVNRILSPKSIK